MSARVNATREGYTPEVFTKLLYRFIGSPPPRDASRAERLRWVRRFYRFSLFGLVLLVIIAATSNSTFLWIAAAALAVWWALGLTSVSLSIRRAATRDE